MIDQDSLQKRIRRLAGTLPQEAGPETEAGLLAQFRARRNHRRRFRVYWAALAASLILFGAVELALTRTGSSRQLPTIAGQGNRSAGFVALPYSQSGVPLEQPVIVRVEIPVSELTGIGAAVPATAGKKVSADLLVGQDGVARAVRLVE